MVGIFLLAACEKPVSSPAGTTEPRVKAFTLSDGGQTRFELTGTLRAPVESPLAFQVSGRIAARLVNAGQSVVTGQPLFELDQRDLAQSQQATEADLAAAKAALATAEADLARQQLLLARNFISQQALERFSLLKQEAKTRWESALARHQQAQNALGYARLRAPADGVLIEVSGEPGQVVNVGQTVALLAQSRTREIEVYLPEGLTPPATGEIVIGDGQVQPIHLREVAGALDPQGRTRRARYTILGATDALILGAVLHARFERERRDADTFLVPLGALSERGDGAHIWRIRDGHVVKVAVSVLSVENDRVRIRGPLEAGQKIVALGTHLLMDNMPVRIAGQ